MGSRQNAVLGKTREVVRREQDRHPGALGRTRRGKQQEHLVVTGQEGIDLPADELVMGRGFEPPKRSRSGLSAARCAWPISHRLFWRGSSPTAGHARSRSRISSPRPSGRGVSKRLWCSRTDRLSQTRARIPLIITTRRAQRIEATSAFGVRRKGVERAASMGHDAFDPERTSRRTQGI